jgi:hypothetical protein
MRGESDSDVIVVLGEEDLAPVANAFVSVTDASSDSVITEGGAMLMVWHAKTIIVGLRRC